MSEPTVEKSVTPDNIRPLRAEAAQDNAKQYAAEPALRLSGLYGMRATLTEAEEHARYVEAACLRALAVREVLREATEKLRQVFDIESLLKPLHDLPSEIKAARLSATSAQAVLDQAFDQLKVAEANIEMDVSSEINEMGKPRYSNAESRAAAVRTRKQADPAYQEALEFVQGSKQLVAERQAELDMLLQTFDAAKLAAQLTAAQLAAIQR